MFNLNLNIYCEVILVIMTSLIAFMIIVVIEKIFFFIENIGSVFGYQYIHVSKLNISVLEYR